MKKEYPLKDLNTMGFDIIAKYFYEVNSLSDIDRLIEREDFMDVRKLILGGGSNILFANEYYDGMIIHSNLKGISIIDGQQTTDNGQQFEIVRCM